MLALAQWVLCINLTFSDILLKSCFSLSAYVMLQILLQCSALCHMRAHKCVAGVSCVAITAERWCAFYRH